MLIDKYKRTFTFLISRVIEAEYKAILPTFCGTNLNPFFLPSVSCRRLFKFPFPFVHPVRAPVPHHASHIEIINQVTAKVPTFEFSYLSGNEQTFERYFLRLTISRVCDRIGSVPQG